MRGGSSHSRRGAYRIAVALSSIVFVAAACSSSNTPKPQTSGILSFDQDAAADSNDPVEQADPFFACGSRTAEFGTEVEDVPDPSKVTVRFQWGDVVPGKQVFVTGTVQNPVLGQGGDFPITHPFGDDLTWSTQLDKPFAKLSQLLGVGNPPGPFGTLHSEIEQNILPHQGTQILPGFMPQEGDRVAAFGRWVIDCGHNDYHTELHPPTFLSFAHQEGGATVAHVLANPYRDTELYNRDTTLSTELENRDRFRDPNTQTFGPYLFGEIVRAAQLGPEGPLCCDDRLRSYMLIDAWRLPPTTWYVCAPGQKPDSGSLSVTSHFTVRPGVTVTATPRDDIGCVEFRAVVGPSYRPLDPTMVECSLSWDELTERLRAGLNNPDLDVLKLIEAKVPPEAVKVVERDPVWGCFDPIQADPPGGPDGRSMLTDDGQPYPFYGDVKVSWSS